MSIILIQLLHNFLDKMQLFDIGKKLNNGAHDSKLTRIVTVLRIMKIQRSFDK